MTFLLKKDLSDYGMYIITDKSDDTGIAFSSMRMKGGDIHTVSSHSEKAVLLMTGEIEFTVDGHRYHYKRQSLFDESPIAIHASFDSVITIEAISDSEIAIFETKNNQSFSSKIYDDVDDEHRGRDTCLRYVRTIFDGQNAPPEAKLVLGEVVNFPGRWSSYPPHHHPQPEIYHYRFNDIRGYGHAELDDTVYKVKHFDTIKILDEKDHAQCSAPGYAMYYIWVIRHLENARYTVPEFTQEHQWTMDPEANIWAPKEEVMA